LLEDTHGWLADCGWEADVDEVDDALVRELVHRQYAGGWPTFVVAYVDLLNVAPRAKSPLLPRSRRISADGGAPSVPAGGGDQ